MSEDRALAKELLGLSLHRNAALIAIMLKNLPDEVRTRMLDAVLDGNDKIELRTRVESKETEMVLVPTDESEPLWLARVLGR